MWIASRKASARSFSSLHIVEASTRQCRSGRRDSEAEMATAPSMINTFLMYRAKNLKRSIKPAASHQRIYGPTSVGAFCIPIEYLHRALARQFPTDSCYHCGGKLICLGTFLQPHKPWCLKAPCSVYIGLYDENLQQ